MAGDGRLTPAVADRWTAQVQRAVHRLDAEAVGYAAGVHALLRAVVPLRPDPSGRSRSAAARSAFGAVAVTPVADDAALAVLLVHEVQHLKLDAVLDVCELFDPPTPGGCGCPGATIPARWRARCTASTPTSASPTCGGTDPASRRPRTSGATRDWTDGAVDALLDLGSLTADGERFIPADARHPGRLAVSGGRSALAAATVGLTPGPGPPPSRRPSGRSTRRASPAQAMGAFAEHVRRQADARRSAHPQTSFAALGPTAATLTARHDLDCHLGDRSPLGALYAADALVLLLGVDWSVCTAFHLAEYRCRRPAPRRAYRCYVRDPAGGRVRRDFQAPHLDDGDFPLIGAAVVAHGSVRSGPVGSAESHCVRLRHAVDVARGWLDEHRLA